MPKNKQRQLSFQAVLEDNFRTFIAQWLIWDHVRGGKANNHAIFPGNHKNT